MSGAPLKKLPASPSVSSPSVPIADRGGEEVNVGFSDLRTGSSNQLRDPRLRTLVHLQRPKRFRIVSERSTQELVPKNDCSRGGCILFPAKRGPWNCLQPVFASLRNSFLGAGR